MDRQFNQFARSLDPAKGRRFKILDIVKTGDELKIIVGTGEPPSAHTCFRFSGVTDFDTFIFGGEEEYSLPQYFNSLRRGAKPQYEAQHIWELLGDGAEWTFIASHTEVILL